HQTAQIVESLPKAIENGLSVPLVYNCGGYESIETIKLLDGIFDIYMPDFKYGDNGTALKYSGAKDYVERAKESIKEMHRQVGDLVLDKNGIAERGLMIRHLVLPCGVARTREVMRFIAKEISKDTYVNIMGQYRPCYMASKHPPLDRRVTEEEVEEAVRIAKKEGLWRLTGIIE
ncbi:MAG: radical SAM protein, partial [Thermodesulfobacteriota bacterium]